MGRLAAIEWAPLTVPWYRRLQTMAVMHYVFVFLILPIMCLWVPVYILFTRVWWIMLLYVVWFWYDLDTPKKGSRPTRWYRKSALWRYFADYFPITLVKTAELSPDKNYIIASHPHGVISMGAFTSLCTDATGFTSKFPGITPTLMTLVGQFWFPFRREYSMLSGGVESSRESLKWLLRNPGYGRAVGIVVGGAAEVLDAHPGCYDLNLARRRGFIRFALRFGADLVPMYHFGENNIYDQFPNPRGSKLRCIQIYIKKMFGFTPPLLRGRGIFNYSFGLLPYRTPITSVMGAPIPVERLDDPTEAQVDELHERYCTALTNLFEEHKTKYGVPSDAHLHYY